MEYVQGEGWGDYKFIGLENNTYLQSETAMAIAMAEGHLLDQHSCLNCQGLVSGRLSAGQMRREAGLRSCQGGGG